MDRRWSEIAIKWTLNDNKTAILQPKNDQKYGGSEKMNKKGLTNTDLRWFELTQVDP